MTTIISRLYKDESTAKKVMKDLKTRGFPDKLMEMVGAGEDAQSKMEAAHVNSTSAAAYAGKMAEGNAVVVVRAPVTPFGIAKAAMEIVDSKPSIDAGVENENEFIRSSPAPRKSGGIPGAILSDHPRFLTPAPSERKTEPSTITDKFGFQLLSSGPRQSSVMPGGKLMTSPPHLREGERRKSVMDEPRHMSTAFWPMPLLDTSERRSSVRRGGGFPFSEELGLPLLIRR